MKTPDKPERISRIPLFTALSALVLVFPSLIYILVNFYWYLFDGNKLNPKFGPAMAALFIGLSITWVIYVLEEL